MTQCWEPGTQYDDGDCVEFEGSEYRLIQPHRSQSDWDPSVTPALWGRTQGHNNGGYNYGNSTGDGGYNQQQEHCGNDQQQQYGNNQGYSQDQSNNPYGYGGNNNNQQSYDNQQGGGYDNPQGQNGEEETKNWGDEEESRQKKITLAKGLLAGAAVLGAGYYFYKRHEDNKEEEEAQAQGFQDWLRESDRRTQDFFQNGPRGPTTWLLVQGKNFPRHTIVGGEETGTPFYIARAFIDGGLQLGKASTSSQKGASIGYSNENHELETYEVLVGNMGALQWVDVSGELDVEDLGARPVEGGHENNAAPLYIARAYYKTGVHPGKIGPGYDGAFVVYGSEEEKVKKYAVLCYA